jgi:hypothetical protein
VISARMMDKPRADLLGINGEYNFHPCGPGAFFWKFIDPVRPVVTRQTGGHFMISVLSQAIVLH